MNRRGFLKLSVLSAIAAGAAPRGVWALNPGVAANKTETIFANIVNVARKENWETMPMGMLVVKVAESFMGTPYVGGTLEGGGGEMCRLDLAGLDCVTFFEDSLCLARILKKGKYTMDDYIKEITFTRYRHGRINGYASRLHYTADWITDNINKGVVRDVTQSLGGDPVHFSTDFMSQNPGYYADLKNDSAMVKTIAGLESKIKARTYYVLPKEKLKLLQDGLSSGDIIAIATSIPGLDYSHTGLIAIGDKFKPHFLHASSAKKEVVLDAPIAEYLAPIKKDIGITVLRPLEVDG